MRSAAELPDPVLSVGVENLPVNGSDRFSTTREGMTMKRIAIGQEWISGEKRSARRAAAAAVVAREQAAVAGMVAETRLQTAIAYVDAYYAGELLRLAAVNEKHAREEFETASALVASTRGSSGEALALSAARGRADDESAESRQLERSALVSLERWTGTGGSELVAPALASPQAEAAWVDSHPAVVARKRDIEVARHEATVTATGRRPNWTWEIAYGQRTGYSDLLSVGVSIPLPIAPGARQDRETAAKLAMVDKAEAELAEALRTAQGEYRSLSNDVRRLQERIVRYREGVLLPSQQRTAVATAAYGSNQASLAALFEARHAELEAQRRVLALQRDLAKAQAQLSFKPLDVRELP